MRLRTWVLSIEPPDWVLYGIQDQREGRATTLDGAFAAFYNALNSKEAIAAVEVFHDFRNPQPGIYRIQVTDRPDGGLNFYSPDILGLSIGEADPEAAKTALPAKIAAILSKQTGNIRKTV